VCRLESTNHSNIPMTSTPTLEHGKTYKIRTKRGSFLATVEGPIQDGSSEFYIVSTPDGDFDVEFDGRAAWEAGKNIGLVQISALRA